MSIQKSNYIENFPKCYYCKNKIFDNESICLLKNVSGIDLICENCGNLNRLHRGNLIKANITDGYNFFDFGLLDNSINFENLIIW